MEILTEKRCIIGEGPVWNEPENSLYFTNGGGKEYCRYDFGTKKLSRVSLDADCAAFAFARDGRMLVSRADGVFFLNRDGGTTDVYDTSRYAIKYANDMKVGPDGCIYVGTQSGRRAGFSDKKDGKLYRIDKNGGVRVLLDGLILSNGMAWSADERFFYHTDSDTNTIREYRFDATCGEIEFAGRQTAVTGVDGFTIGGDGKIYAACWGMGHIATVDTGTMEICGYIELPCKIPTSCMFCGKGTLVVTTASFECDVDKDKNAGFTILLKMDIPPGKSYLYG